MAIDSLLHQYQITYYKLPKSVKTFLGTVYGHVPLGIRFGKAYRQHKDILDQFENASEQYRLDYQYNKTLETLFFAYDHIPYYKKLFDDHGFHPTKFKDLRDISKLPYLTKEIIQKELSNMYTDKLYKPTTYYTGGSSSVPMQIYAPRSISRSKEKVYANYVFSKLGYKYREKAVSMSARGKANEEKNLYWEYQMIDNYLLVSVNHLEKAYINYILNEVEEYKPKIFFGYPSAIILFIKTCKSIGIDTYKLGQLKGVVLASESVTHEQIEYIKNFFHTSVVSHYGHTERVVSGYRIDKNEYMFLNSYGLVRVVNDEIVGTSFDNFVMPYINYRTKDYINGETMVYDNTDIVKSAKNIQGRIQEFIVTKDLITVPLLSIGAGHFDSFEHIEKVQFYQETPGEVTLRIQTKSPNLVQVKTIISQMEKQMNNKIEFKIELVDNIKKTNRRKSILCIQKLDIEKYYRG